MKIENHVESLTWEELVEQLDLNDIPHDFDSVQDDDWPDYEDSMRVKLIDKLETKHPV